jgi:hypothetical protein
LESVTEIITVNSIEKLPNLDYIKNIPRSKKLKIVFSKSLNHLRENFGQSLKTELPNFQIGIHSIKPEIHICKLITHREIITHQDFFENCAKDYRNLATELILRLIEKNKIKLHPDFPFLTFNQIKGSKKHKGKMDDWEYFFHGYHCYFKNHKTKQEIEVPIMFGIEFGDLDPYFFSIYIKSTPQYQPLPVYIYENFNDGRRILDVMLNLGLFERINSNIKNHHGIVVTDREKVRIKIYNPEKDYVSTKFDILKFLRIRR